MCQRSSDVDGASEFAGEIYHERQSLQMCALHTLNNLLQRKNAVTKQQLDDLCQQLSPNSWLNPHKSPLGLGNYDVNILMTALRVHNLDTIWFDRRKDVAMLDLVNIYGLVLNVPAPPGLLGSIPLLFSRKHWFAVRRLGVDYYNLDSKLDKPELVARDDAALVAWLRSRLSDEQVQMLVVVRPDVAEAGSWQRGAEDRKGGAENGKGGAEGANGAAKDRIGGEEGLQG